MKPLKQAIDQYWETVPFVWGLIHSHMRSIVMDRFDISIGQFYVYAIFERAHLRRDIADARQISRPAISQEVDLLVEKGLITRQQEADDGALSTWHLLQRERFCSNKLFTLNRTWMKERWRS